MFLQKNGFRQFQENEILSKVLFFIFATAAA